MPIKKKKKTELKYKIASTKEIVRKKQRAKKIKEVAEEKKEIKTEETKLEKVPEVNKQTKNYNYAVGRRKSAVARIRYYQEGNGEIIINGRDYHQYFPYFQWQNIILSPLVLLGHQNKGKFSIKVSGGGSKGQSESIRHGLAKLMVAMHPDSRVVLKRAGFLMRDARVKERKKYGLKRARRAPQWQKR